MSACIEVVTFKLKSGADIDRFVESAQHLNAILPQVEGFRKRQLAYDAESTTWIDIVNWSSIETAREASQKVMESDECSLMFQMIDESSVKMHHFSVKC